MENLELFMNRVASVIGRSDRVVGYGIVFNSGGSLIVTDCVVEK